MEGGGGGEDDAAESGEKTLFKAEHSGGARGALSPLACVPDP